MFRANVRALDSAVAGLEKLIIPNRAEAVFGAPVLLGGSPYPVPPSFSKINSTGAFYHVLRSSQKLKK